MYVPAHFRPEKEAELYDVIDRYMFASVISSADDTGLRSTMVPFILREEEGRLRLWGHMARANPQWRDFRPDREVLIIFRGPHAYISPAWYADEPNVPTWNFLQVQVHGRPQVLAPDDPRVLWVLEQTVIQAESRFEQPWRFENAGGYPRKLAPGVAAFEIAIDRIEGSFKLSQNQRPANRLNVMTRTRTQNRVTIARLPD